MKRVLITGIAGQDGSYMSELLIDKGYEVFGFARIGSDVKYVPKKAHILYGDMADEASLRKAVQESRPDEVYNFGGITDLKTAFVYPERTMKINYEAVGILMDEAVKVNSQARFLQASSSEIFIPRAESLDEHSPRDWNTTNPYARSKMIADRDFVVYYREKNVFICSAILFNHDSPRRLKSVTTKIVKTLVNIKKRKENCLYVGNVDMCRDWGFAGDYVLAMWKMLQVYTPNDLVIATGNSFSVKDFIDITARELGLKLVWHGEGINTYAVDDNGNKIVSVSPEFYKPSEKYYKVGNSSKAKNIIDWKPKIDLKELIRIMTNELSLEL